MLKDRDVARQVDGKIGSKCKKMMLQLWLIVLIFAPLSIFQFVMILAVVA